MSNILLDGCGVCGGILVEIRGRYPNQPRRTVCPTCLADRIEMIEQIATKDYGKQYQAKGNTSDRKSETGRQEASKIVDRQFNESVAEGDADEPLHL